MPDTLYSRDVLIWSEQQSELLQRLARGERVNADIDWPNLIEEVRDLGLSQLHACESLLAQAILHLLKMQAWPDGPVGHWRSETRGFLAGARRRFSPSMCQRLDLVAAYRVALEQVRDLEIDGNPPGGVAPVCRLTLDDLLAEPVDFSRLLARVSPG